jgi:hypothetical protein
MLHHAGREAAVLKACRLASRQETTAFHALLCESHMEGDTIMTTATLVKVVRDPRSGEVHLPSEQVAVLRVTRNLDRTLLKVRWQSGGHCVVFPDDIEKISQN